MLFCQLKRLKHTVVINLTLKKSVPSVSMSILLKPIPAARNALFLLSPVSCLLSPHIPTSLLLPNLLREAQLLQLQHYFF